MTQIVAQCTECKGVILKQDDTLHHNCEPFKNRRLFSGFFNYPSEEDLKHLAKTNVSEPEL